MSSLSAVFVRCFAMDELARTRSPDHPFYPGDITFRLFKDGDIHVSYSYIAKGYYSSSCGCVYTPNLLETTQQFKEALKGPFVMLGERVVGLADIYLQSTSRDMSIKPQRFLMRKTYLRKFIKQLETLYADQQQALLLRALTEITPHDKQ